MKSRLTRLVNSFTAFVVVGSNFLPLVGFVLLVSCRSAQPIVTDTEKKKDSTVVTDKSIQKDSIIDRESVTEKIIPQSEVIFSLGNAARLDSIIAVLKSMPKGLPQIITIPDKSHNATIQLFMDSLGRMAVRCTSAEKKYYEKDVQKERYISSLVNQLTQKNIELRETKTENAQLKKTFWQKMEDAAQNVLLKILLIIIAIGFLLIFIEIVIKKSKSILAWIASTIIKKTP